MASKDHGLTPIELSSFCSEIALMLGAGMPLYAGMEALEKTYEDDAHAALYRGVSETLTQTGSLRDALESAHAFPTYLVEMCGVGERTGHLEDVMQGAFRLLRAGKPDSSGRPQRGDVPAGAGGDDGADSAGADSQGHAGVPHRAGQHGRDDDRDGQRDDERRHGAGLGGAGAGTRLCAGGAGLRAAAQEQKSRQGACRAEKRRSRRCGG